MNKKDIPMKIAFRVDGSNKIGSGHLMRCMTLANEFRKNNHDTLFISFKENNNLNYLMKENNFNVHEIKFDHEWNQYHDYSYLLNKFNKNEFDILFIDHYNIDSIWENKIKYISKKIFVIDDLANREHFCDYLLDQNLCNNLFERYNNLVNANTMKFLGPIYALLREEFIVASNKAEIRNKGLENLLITFGNSDNKNITINIIKLILNSDIKFKNIDIVIGKNFQNINDLKNLLNNSENVNLYVQTSKISELMLKADLCIGAGGSTSWERCFLGLPTLVLETAENQKEIIKSICEKGAAIEFDFQDNFYKLLEILMKIKSDKNLLKKMSINSFDIISNSNYRGVKYIYSKLTSI